MARLDSFISDREGISRSKAKDFILRNRVFVNGINITKPSFSVSSDDLVKILYLDESYVSRAGEKLEFALEYFHININGYTALDVGSSTGGFTECLLRKGVHEVDSVDVGKDQLDDKLKQNPRVYLYEQMDIRKFNSDKHYNIITVDVSFISVELIVDSLRKLSKNETNLIVLIKPQFEVGNLNIGKSGIVKSQKLHDKAIDKVVKIFSSNGFKFCGIIKSPILGKSGNKEFLAYFKFIVEEEC